MRFNRTTVWFLLLISACVAITFLLEKKFSYFDVQLKDVQPLVSEYEKQKVQLKELKEILAEQTDQLHQLEAKFSATLLTIKTGKADPASEELVQAILAARHDALLLIELAVAQALQDDQPQQAFSLLMKNNIMSQKQKIKLASYLQHRYTWNHFQHELKEGMPQRQTQQVNSYLALLGIKIEQPVSTLEQQKLHLLSLVEEKNFNRVCLLRPWEGLTSSVASKLDDLCDPLPLLHYQLEH
jgi:hypothetical protein